MGLLRVPANDRFDGGRGRLHASRDHHDVRAAQRRERLAQAARGQHHAAAKWIRRVDEHDVGIARQFQMLKSVVQHEPIDSVPRQDHAVLVPVRADSELNFSRQPLAQQRNFIALRNAARSASTRSSIPARQNRRVLPFRGERSAIASTIGVLPVPPTVRFPTLITVPGNLRVRKIPRA